MHWLLWTIMALVSLTAVIVVMVRVRSHDAKRSTAATRTAWLVAATISGATLVSIAAEVIHIIPNATAVDIGAVAVTGVLTGLFLAFALTPRSGAAAG